MTLSCDLICSDLIRSYTLHDGYDTHRYAASKGQLEDILEDYIGKLRRRIDIEPHKRKMVGHVGVGVGLGVRRRGTLLHSVCLVVCRGLVWGWFSMQHAAITTKLPPRAESSTHHHDPPPNPPPKITVLPQLAPAWAKEKYSLGTLSAPLKVDALEYLPAVSVGWRWRLGCRVGVGVWGWGWG